MQERNCPRIPVTISGKLAVKIVLATWRGADAEPVVGFLWRDAKLVYWNGLAEVILPVKLDKTPNGLWIAEHLCGSELLVAN